MSCMLVQRGCYRMSPQPGEEDNMELPTTTFSTWMGLDGPCGRPYIMQRIYSKFQKSGSHGTSRGIVRFGDISRDLEISFPGGYKLSKSALDW